MNETVVQATMMRWLMLRLLIFPPLVTLNGLCPTTLILRKTIRLLGLAQVNRMVMMPQPLT